MGSTNEPGNHALIFGASGITGWAITNALLSDYPSPDAFSKVTALTNRPLSKEQAQWPESSKLQLVSGIDLLMDGGQQGLEKEMQSKIGDMSTVSHVYFFSYVMDLDPAKEISINVTLLERAVTAVENLSKNLKYVVLPTGTKAYGVHLIDKFPFTPPLAENLPRIPEPYASEMFYYNQLDMLASLAKGKQWTWCEVRPDVVVGFVPNNNVYCLAQALALYLSCYAAVAGPGASVEFPGTAASWTILSNDSSQDILAKFSIWASLHPSETGGQAFNVADNARPSSWSEKWPVICEFFGLKGVGPPPNGGSGPQPGEYLVEHVETWRELEQKHGLQKGRVEGNERSFGGFPYFIMTMFNFDRQMDMSKLHETWGDEKVETDAKGAWWTAFERFRRAKIIP
ncbi:hypothetical protein W97_06601 [Coniosporium apollinis CBS 100218]|uniref:PRISE-like Rossmann-fold domain-containing protein n=1 Tax=Coniosporium apollinis (strain CBS 100218) TaxID=1168221 RepID=R7YZT0_CONA1|nr:uncharacterized protein W97_06601 [Coniosporium apollinis CBS 100218]EON67348.1 hypothetical protein W97_06601 [Coniosporium apollinis CBS 100218]